MVRTSLCSPAKPWGIHPAIADHLCPRCGWTAREPAETLIPDGDPPLTTRHPLISDL